ncbi:hypothetical protein KCU81_g6839, partial [Aureobasidium melanogenum]|uniref:Uncharacterized protein n=1 Tax=Aureobasidium melanogenum (strain CBS 110374) TaxID=1043003 RepID=A0A074VT51_AURM1
MAPLPYRLNAALTVTGDMLSTHTVAMPLNMAMSTACDHQPVPTMWNNDLPVPTNWVNAVPTSTVEYVSILVTRQEPENSGSEVEYVDESSSPIEGDGVDAGDETSVDETPIDDENSGDWQTAGDDGDEITDESNNDNESQNGEDGSNDGTTKDNDSEDVDDASEPVAVAGTAASAETIASDLQEKYPDMPTSIDECINTEDEIFTHTDENGNVIDTVNCTALANMETWYLLPCDDKCRKDLKKVIPAVVIESGIAGGLLPTILNNHGLWSSSPATQTAVVEWLTTQLQQVRNRLSTDWFDWSSVRHSIKELLTHPPVDTPDFPSEIEPFDSDPSDSDPFEDEPYEVDDTPYEGPFDSDILREAELDVEEAKDHLETVKKWGDETEVRAAEEDLVEAEELLKMVQENMATDLPDDYRVPKDPNEDIVPEDPEDNVPEDSNEDILPEDPTEAPDESTVPEDPMQPPPSIEEETATATRELEKALEQVRETYKDYQEVKNNPDASSADKWLRRQDWLEAKKELKVIRKAIRDHRLPVDDPGAADPTANDADAAQPAKAIDQEEVAKAQKKVDELKEASGQDAQKAESLDEDIQNMLDNPPEEGTSPEAVETYEEGLKNLQNLKQSTLEHMAKLKKELRIADRALKKAKGELKVQFPDDPVDGEQDNPYDTGNDEPSKPDDAVEPSEPDDTIGEDDYYNGLDGSDDHREDVGENDEPTEVDEPSAPGSTEAEGPSEVDEPTEVDEPNEVDEGSKSDGSSDGDGGVEIDVPAPGGGAIVPPGVVPPPPPPVIPIPGYGDVTAPTKALQGLAGVLKDAAEGLWHLTHSKKKDPKAIKKQEKKVEEAKKKLEEEQEKEAKREEKRKQEKKKKEQEQKKHAKEQKKHDKEEQQAAEDKKKSKTSSTTAKHSAISTTKSSFTRKATPTSTTKTTSSSTTKSTSTSTTTTKTPEPTVHHKQHDAEITFHGKHSHKFELYGKDWARGKHDADKLRSNMESCGMEIKDWEFSYAADKPEIKTSDWSFYAKGELVRKTAADVRCLNKVIKEANGPENLISETEGVDKTDDKSDNKGDGADTAGVQAQIAFTDKHFTLYGKGFAKDKDSGEQLKHKFEDCSKVKDWKFYTQKKDHDMQLKKQGWDFYAEGEVKKIKRKCLNEAIQGMGGPMEAIAEGTV